MNTPTRVKKIYAELRRVYGTDLPAHELMECASLIADACEDAISPTPVTVIHGRTPFSELPVDEVIDKFSWRIMSQDPSLEDDYEPTIPAELLLEQTLLMAA